MYSTWCVRKGSDAAPLLRAVDECVLAGVRVIIQHLLEVLQQLRQAGVTQVASHLPNSASSSHALATGMALGSQLAAHHSGVAENACSCPARWAPSQNTPP